MTYGGKSTIPWDAAREAEAARLWAAGKSAKEIAAALGGVSRNAVIGKIHRLGIAKRSTGCAPPPARRLAAVSAAAKRDGSGAPPGRPRNLTKGKSPRKAVKKPTARPVPVTDAAALARAITLMETRNGRCRFPLLNLPRERAAEQRFCGERCGLTDAYCAGHAARTRNKRPPLRKPKDDPASFPRLRHNATAGFR